MHCVAAVHGPVAPSVHCTALNAAPDGTCWSGAADGSITCWRHQQLQADESVTQPVAVLQGHAYPVVALLSGLTAPEPRSSSSSSSGSSDASATYLLSLDAEGWVGLWDYSSWVCLDMTRAAPLPPSCTPAMTLMPDGAHVCIIIPATPNLQQEQQTLWQHQRQHQQQQAAHNSPLTSPQQQQYTGPTGPATAANLSPMMLVLRWQSLALVAAPLVSNLGLVALTSSSITLDQADAVVASAVISTAPALAPTAADTVVLAVMRSGWMWAGSLNGSSLGQAWDKPLVSGGSSSPLRHSCLWATSSSTDSYSRSAGGSSSPGPCKRSAALQLQLLVVQPDGWRLFVCSSFSSTDGMPQQWVQLAQQLQGPSYSRLHSHSSRRQGALHSRLAAGAASASAGGRVRFDLGACQTGQLRYSDNKSSCSSSSSSSSSGMSEDSETESAGEGEEVIDAEGEGHVGRKGSRLRRAAGPAGRQHIRHEQGLQLLGGTLLQPTSSGAVNSNDAQFLQGRQQQAQTAAVAGMVWTECGEQQLWSVVQQPDSSTAFQQQQQQQQQQHVQLVQQLKLQPWPAYAAVKLFAAVDRLHSSVSLVVQHSRHIHHHHHHQHHQHHQHSHSIQQQPGDYGDADWLFSELPHKWCSDWHLHCMHLQLQGPQQAADTGVTAMQQAQLQLSHCQGALGAAWSRHGQHADMHTDSSSIDQHSTNLQEQQPQQQPEAESSSSIAGVEAMQLDTDGAVSSSSRKRPAADEPAAEPVTDSSVGQVGCGPEPGRAKQPRVHSAGPDLHKTGQQTPAGLAAASLLDGQQQQVTHVLLLGSDAPGMHQVGVILASGTILFYDLATYCVPGAAWHPDCCVVGSGHTGRVSTILEVTFKCPPQHLLGCAGVADSTQGSLPRPVNWHFSSAASGRGDQSRRSSVDAGASSSGDASASRGAHMHVHAQGQCYEPVPDCPAAAQGWSRRPAQGGAVPLLLTGGRDGSLRAWDLRLQHLGQTWMAVHPHAAPVEAVVLPPVSSRLPWSTCVLSVCAAGRVGMTCLASGTTTRTFDGWDLGPPAQLAWSTGRGLLAAGGWDGAGVWQVAVWDTYSGHMDRQLQGAAAHMLMASLAQELTSSMRHLSRVQAQPHARPAVSGTSAVPSSTAGQHTEAGASTAAGLYGLASNGYGQYYSSSASGSKRASLDIPYSSSSQAASGDGTKGSSSSGTNEAAGGFVPRLQLVHHTGPLKPVPYGKQDMLLLDVDVQQLMLQLEACSKQQKRENSRQRQQHTGSQSNSIDIDSSTASARASRASSLDLLGLVQGGSPSGAEGYASVGAAAVNSSRTSPQQQQQHGTPRAGALAGQLHALQGTAAAITRQGSVASAVEAAAEQGGMQGPAKAGVAAQQGLVPGRAVMVPAVSAALQGLCLLHKWGLEPQLDKQLVLLLGQLQGWPDSGLGGLLTPSSSSSRSMSPTTPTAPLVGAAVTTAAAGMAADIHSGVFASDTQSLLLVQLQHLLEGPASGSPVLQATAPCLTQDVLLSPRCHAAVIALPSAHSSGSCTDKSSSQQKDNGTVAQEQRKISVAGSRFTGHATTSRPSCLLLAACPSLWSCRLLTLVAVSKWLMATIPSHTSVNTCSGLVTLYALHSTDLLAQAAVAAVQPHAPAASASAAGAATPMSPGAACNSIRGGSPLQQQHQQQHLGNAPQAPLLPDLLLVASTSLACPGLLAEAAQLLLAALLHPAAPGTYLLPALGHTQPVGQLGWASPPQQQQQQQQQSDTAVFTSPGAAAAASCWPAAVLQLAVLHAQQHQQSAILQANPGVTAAAAGSGLSLQQLPLWLPQLVLSAAAAVAHPTRVPPELLAAVSAGLLDVLLGAAPAHSSCVAASWLCQVLRGGHWGLWRPYLGKPGHLAQRLCHLIDRLQASSTDSRTAASHLVNQSLSTAPGLLPANTPSSSSSSSGAPTSTSTGTDFILLTQQPYAVADPLTALSGVSKSLSSGPAAFPTASSSSSSVGGAHTSGWAQWRPQHVEGGLLLSAALMGSTGAASQGSWGAGVGVSRSASPAAGAVAGLIEVSPVARAAQAGGSGAVRDSGGFGSVGLGSAAGSASGALQQQQQQQQYAGLLDLHRTSSGITYSYTAVQHSHGGGTVSTAKGSGTAASTVSVKFSQITAGVSSISQQQPQQQGVGVRVSRSVLVVWLRAALDVLAALTHVDPAAVLMELSHKLAAPGAESSGSSLTLLMAALSRLLKRPSERHSLLPHLGFMTALAVQALDPTRPLLRHTLLQPVMGVLRDLSEHFPQVDCHSSSLQVAVGSTRALAGPSSGAAAPRVGGGASVSCIQAPTVAVFDMNGGTKKKVLLLPVLMDEPEEQQQQQQEQQHGGPVPGQKGLHDAPAGPVHGAARHVGPFGSTSSLLSTTSSASTAAANAAAASQVPMPHMSGALPGLWSTAEGVADATAGEGGATGGRGSSGWSGVLGGSSSSLSSSTALDTPGDSMRGSTAGLGELQRGTLAANTMTRAEAAMVEGWFGGSTGSSSDGTAPATGTTSVASAQTAPGGAGMGGTVGAGATTGAGYVGHASQRQPSSMQCGVIYPDAASANSPILCASEVAGGVAAVAFSPGGDAVAAFVLACHCLVVWRLGASWTQKLAHLGSSRPMSQMPHAYIRLPQAALLVNAVFKDSTVGTQQQQQQHHRHHRQHHHHHCGQEGDDHGGGGGGEVLQWQLKWQTDSHIDLLYQGCLCGSVEVHL